MLALGAFEAQAVKGPCIEPAPWAWNAEERARWAVWSQLGRMGAPEAQYRYVQTVELDCAGWWGELQAMRSRGHTAELERGAAGGGEEAGFSLPPDAAWAPLAAGGGAQPAARYEHAACLASPGGPLYVCGGDSGRRLLGDLWSLDLTPLAKGSTPLWSAVGVDAAHVLPPVAGHAVVVRPGLLLCVGGRQRGAGPDDVLQVYALDVQEVTEQDQDGGQAARWRELKCAPDAKSGAPCARRLHSAVVHGDGLWVFGGEAAQSKALNDLWRLDLEELRWSKPAAAGDAPSARSAHTACVHGGKLHIFGGCSYRSTAFFNDVHSLDLATLAWERREVSGSAPAPRAGHSGALVGARWLIAGGGNSASGLGDTFVLDLVKMLWTEAVPAPALPTTRRGRTAASAATTAEAATRATSGVAFEGMSTVAIGDLLGAPAILAFGGYNGRVTTSLRALPLAEPRHGKAGGRDGNGSANGSIGVAAAAAATAEVGGAIEGVERALAAAERAVQALAVAARPQTDDPAARKAAAVALDTALVRGSSLSTAISSAEGLRALMARVHGQSA